MSNVRKREGVMTEHKRKDDNKESDWDERKETSVHTDGFYNECDLCVLKMVAYLELLYWEIDLRRCVYTMYLFEI